MKKKPSKEKVLKAQIEELKQELQATKNDLARKTEKLVVIEELVSTNDNFAFSYQRKDVKDRVLELVLFRKSHYPEVGTISSEIFRQREIIMWLVNPKTAEQSKELDALKNDPMKQRFN